MPDDDRMEAVTSALAATLRDVPGVPDLREIAARMQEAAASGAAIPSRVPGSEGARRHVPTDVTERAAAGFAATMRSELSLVSPAQATLLLGRRGQKHAADLYRSYIREWDEVREALLVGRMAAL